MIRQSLIGVTTVLAQFAAGPRTEAADRLIPPRAQIKTDRPRLLLRPRATRYAVSLDQLRSTAKDDEFRRVLEQLRRQQSAAAQAMVWLLTGEKAAADRAVERMRGYQYPGRTDTFHIFYRLQEFALAYDWLYDYEGFTDAIKADVRGRVLPLAQAGLKQTNDHVFHNYIWMSAGGTALWALATAGEDDPSDRLFDAIAGRMNDGLFPAARYLDGLPCEPMGYWSLYDFAPELFILLATQSAFETDTLGTIRGEQGDWLRRHFDNVVHSTLPNMRYIPWGDLQGGPNGGVTHEMAGIIDAGTWALDSPQGAYMSRWIAQRRGLARFYGDTAVFYMLYTHNLKAEPAEPPLSFLAGNRQSAHFIARSGWGDGDTIVTLRATDHFGDHNHYDQGSFIIYRNGLLAVDPPVYRKVRGPQQATEHHNTLLLGGQAQRPARGQWFVTVEKFKENLTAGRKLETGDMLFSKDAGPWAGASCQFAQAYDPELVASCVRQMLFVRPGTVVIVDRLEAPAGSNLPEVSWLLQLPQEPTVESNAVSSTNGKSWLRCRPLSPVTSPPKIEPTPVGTHRAAFIYPGAETVTLVHRIEVGDGENPGPTQQARVATTADAIQLTLGGKTYTFAAAPPFAVTRAD